MSDVVHRKVEALLDVMRRMESVLVAYSGGVDSALVMAAAHRALDDRALACIGRSPSYPQREFLAAVDLANSIGAPYRVISPQEELDDRYNRNGSDRCYFCKTALFETMQRIAREEGWNAIADGTHLDDVGDHVHGIRAAGDRKVRSPLRELRLSKSDVRELARALHLPVWDKPAMACLASRVPHGTAITPQLLRQVERAEDALAELGFRQFRVRHHGEIARIELAGDEFDRMQQHRREVVEGVRAAGYRFVTLDLLAYHEAVDPRIDSLVQVHVAGQS